MSDDFKVRKEKNLTPILDNHHINPTIQSKTQLSSRVLSPLRSKPYLAGVMVDVNNRLNTIPSSSAFYQASKTEFNPLPEKFNRDIGGVVDMSDKEPRHCNKDQNLRSLRNDRITMPPLQESYQNFKRDFPIGCYENGRRCSRCSNSFIMMRPEDEKKESLYKVQQQFGAGSSIGVNENRDSKLNAASRRRNYSEKILKHRGLHFKSMDNTYSLLKQKEISYYPTHKASI